MEEIEPADITDYRQELVFNLSHAWKQAVEYKQGAQAKYMQSQLRQNKSRHNFKVGEWVLIRFPREESGANCKLFQIMAQTL